MISIRMKDHFVCFSRNGCWGTCGFCPRDSNGHAYPEFCVNKSRYDHEMTLEDLVRVHRTRLAEDLEGKDPVPF